MRFILFFVVCLALSKGLMGQNKQIDSLLKIIESTQIDTVKLDKLLALSNLASQNPDTSLYYGKKALELSSRIKHKLGMMQAYKNLCVANAHRGNLKQALENSANGLDIAKSLSISKSIVDFTTNSANLYSMMGEYNDAEKYFLDANLLAKKINYTNGINSSYANLGTLYMEQSKFEKATEIITKALEIAEKQENYKIIANSNLNLGYIFIKQNLNEKAKFYFIKALKAYGQIKSEIGISKVFSNIALVYCNTGKLDSSLFFHKKALAIEKKLNFESEYASTIYNIGKLYEKKKEFQKALEYCLDALKLKKKTGLNPMIVRNYLTISQIYEELNQTNLEKLYIDSAAVLSKKVKSEESVKEVYDCYASYFEKSKEYKKALENLKESKIHSDSLFNTQRSKIISELEAKYQTQKKEADIQRLAFENKSKQATIYWQFSIASFIVLFLVILLYVRTILANIEKQKLFVQIQESSKLQPFFQYHSMGNKLMSFARLLKEGKVEETKHEIHSFGENIRRLSHQLYTLSSANTDIWLSLNELVHTHSQYIKSDLVFNNHLPDAVRQKTSKQLQFALYNIMQELLQNAEKYADAKQIALTLSVEKRKITLFYEDDGKGVDSKEATGKGTQAIKDLVGIFKGNIEIDSAAGKGYYCTIELPYIQNFLLNNKLFSNRIASN